MLVTQSEETSASTAVTGTVFTHLVYTVPLTTRVTFFKFKGKFAPTAVTGTVYTHFVYAFPLTRGVYAYLSYMVPLTKSVLS